MWRGKIWHGLLGQQCCPNGGGHGDGFLRQAGIGGPTGAATAAAGQGCPSRDRLRIGRGARGGLRTRRVRRRPWRRRRGRTRMSRDKGSAGFVKRRAAARTRAADLLRCATADPGTPAPQGLYDPALDKDSLRRRIHRRHQGPQVAPDHRGRVAHPLQSRASRRGRRRSAHGRRRRHPGADPAQVFRQENRRTRHQAAGARANTRSVICSCRPRRAGGRSSATSMPK